MARHRTYSKRSRESRKALTAGARPGHHDGHTDYFDDHLDWSRPDDGADSPLPDRR